MTCPRCLARGKTWEGDDPRCAFEMSTFSSDNWNCATMNDLRHELKEKILLHHHCGDTNFLILDNEDCGIAEITWYKSRGRTDSFTIFTGGKDRTIGTLDDARILLGDVEPTTSGFYI